MRRIVTLAALVLLLIAARPASAQSPSTDERLDRLEAKVTKLGDIVYGTARLPPPLSVSTDGTSDITIYGNLLSWAGEFSPSRSFRLWCKQFDPTGFGFPDTTLIGLECGWTPNPY